MLCCRYPGRRCNLHHERNEGGSGLQTNQPNVRSWTNNDSDDAEAVVGAKPDADTRADEGAKRISNGASERSADVRPI